MVYEGEVIPERKLELLISSLQSKWLTNWKCSIQTHSPALWKLAKAHNDEVIAKMGQCYRSRTVIFTSMVDAKSKLVCLLRGIWTSQTYHRLSLIDHTQRRFTTGESYFVIRKFDGLLFDAAFSNIMSLLSTTVSFRSLFHIPLRLK